jgi:hypothetical protein
MAGWVSWLCDTIVDVDNARRVKRRNNLIYFAPYCIPNEKSGRRTLYQRLRVDTGFEVFVGVLKTCFGICIATSFLGKSGYTSRMAHCLYRCFGTGTYGCTKGGEKLIGILSIQESTKHLYNISLLIPKCYRSAESLGINLLLDSEGDY